MDSAFGTVLKEWRGRRRMSQLDLGLTADVSARHISFLETGRARPSRAMVASLCEALEVPRAERNSVLHAAGFAPAYRRRDLDAAEMAHVRAAVDWTLDRHAPYPAMALDRHWHVVRANAPMQAMLAGLGVGEGDSLLHATLDVARMRQIIENWEDVGRHLVARLRTESAHLGGDQVLDEAAAALSATLGPAQAPAHTKTEGALGAVLPTRYRTPDGCVLSLMSTMAQFGTAEDIALSELRIEMMFPADDATRAALHALAAGGP